MNTLSAITSLIDFMGAAAFFAAAIISWYSYHLAGSVSTYRLLLSLGQFVGGTWALMAGLMWLGIYPASLHELGHVFIIIAATTFTITGILILESLSWPSE